jgi:uncharacterized protein (DUF342 family)
MSTINGPNSPPTLTDVSVLDPDDGKDAATTESIPLSFSAKKLRVQIRLTATVCKQFPAPPEDLIIRAQAKMQAAQAEGRAAFFTVFSQRLTKAWARMIALGDDAPASVALTLAAGAPELAGLDIKVRADDDALVLISIDPTAGVASWRLEWLELHVRQALREKGITTKANSAQVAGVLARAQAGQPIRNVKIRPALHIVPPPGRPFQLAVNRARREISLVIHDLSCVQDVDRVNQRLARIEQTVGGLTRTHRAGFRILRQDLIEAIDAALGGIESIGLGMPMTLLAAVDAKGTSVMPSARSARRASVESGQQTALNSFLTIAISDDAMTATVTAVSPHLNKDPDRLPPGNMWLHTELERAGVQFGVLEEAATEIRTRLGTGEPMAGIVVARGQMPTGGKDPYLQVVMPEVGEGQADMRAYRKRPLAQTGAVVAEIRCKEPGQPGSTVTGTPLPPLLPTEMPTIQTGDGIEQREPGRFYALFDGVIVADTKSLSLQKILVHEGDANLATGDIVFDGAVEIKGSIESGAKVWVGGDLIIHGDIRGGTVICCGSLSVARGIVAGATGTVRAKGDVKADFVENSTITCGGSLTANLSIMQSRIMAGGGIVVNNKAGVVGGGTYVCAKSLTTGSLGLPDGSKTELNVGSDYRSELSLNIRQARLEALTKKSEEDKRTYREITRKTAAQLSKAERGAKDGLRERVTRWGGVLEKARKHVEVAAGKLTFSGDAQVFVLGRLSTNCKVRIGGKAIPILKEATGVIITTQEQDGSFVRPYSGNGEKDDGKAKKEEEAAPAAPDVSAPTDSAA